jgi:hypothetical protein
LFSTLGAGAIVIWVVWELVAQPMAYVENNAQNELVKTSNEWFDVLIQNLPLAFLFIAAMGSIAFTVYKTAYA